MPDTLPDKQPTVSKYWRQKWLPLESKWLQHLSIAFVQTKTSARMNRTHPINLLSSSETLVAIIRAKSTWNMYTAMHCILTKNSHQLIVTYHELFVLWILHKHITNSLNINSLARQHKRWYYDNNHVKLTRHAKSTKAEPNALAVTWWTIMTSILLDILNQMLNSAHSWTRPYKLHHTNALRLLLVNYNNLAVNRCLSLTLYMHLLRMNVIL